MKTYTFAQLPEWATKVEKVLNAVVSQATSDMLASVRVTPGIARGGGRVPGTIPRDLGALAGSLQSTLYGGTALTGQESYLMVAGQMEAGDKASFTWGGNVAPYAKEVHYGANGVAGTFWVDAMAAGWTTKWVPGALDKAKRELM